MKKIVFPKDRGIYWLVFALLLVKLILLPFSQTDDADAVSRIFISANWIENPYWIYTHVWAPFSFYLIGFGLYIYNNLIITPKIINILFSCFMLFPFYFFTKREFNKNGALIATIVLAISPIIFRNSFVALSETPYLFFLALTMNLLSKSLRRNSVSDMIIAGLSITLASGFRYEAWLIMALFAGIIALYRKWKLAFFFCLTALIFPFLWMVSNWIATGNPMHGIQGNYHWTLEMMDNNANLSFESHLRRIWFFPFSWMIAVGPPLLFITLQKLYQIFTKKPIEKRLVILTIPLITLFIFLQYNSSKGVLLLHHRFIGTIVLFSLPFIADYFSNLNRRKIKEATLYLIIIILLSFGYNTNGVKPLPRIKDQSVVKIVETIQQNTDKNSSLIVDFIGWENTYFSALQSNLPPKNIVINGGAKNSPIEYKKIDNSLKNHSNGVIVLSKNSKFYNELVKNSFKIGNFQLKIEELFQNENVVIYKFTT